MIVEAPFSGATVRMIAITHLPDYFGAIRLYRGGTGQRGPLADKPNVKRWP